MKKTKVVPEKPFLVLRPNFINALAPIFLKNLFYFLIVSSILYGLYFTLKSVMVLDFSIRQIILRLLILSVLIVFLPLIIKIIILFNSRYYFYKTYFMKEFEFFIIRTQSVPYTQIVNITTDISIWDRITKSGDIILHTAEDKAPDVVLSYILYPDKVEKSIYRMVARQKTQRNY